MDWETFSQLTYIDIIEYVNLICMIEDTPIDKILFALKDLDQNSFEEHYLDILELVDTSLMTEKFLLNILPQGSRPERGKVDIANHADHQSTLQESKISNFDPLPYKIVAKRIFLEQIKPSKAYFLFMSGLKKGIKDLDFEAIAAYEISTLFSIRRNEKTLTSDYDLKEIMRFDTSYERFRFLMDNDDFLIVSLTFVYDLGVLPVCQ